MPSYVIVTEPSREATVVATLADHHIAAYCPTERRKHFGLRATTARERAIFPGYVFVHTEDVDRDFETIRHGTPHVVAFLAAGGRPRAIPDAWLGAFLIMQSLGGFDYAADRKPKLRLGQAVRIIAGKWGAMDWVGEVVELRGARVVLNVARGGRVTASVGDLVAA